jgi:4'-phosphopantetheinyl transferase
MMDASIGRRRPLDLWFAYPDDLLKDEVAVACAALLTGDERARWQAFRFERDRREYLATRALVRAALSHYRAIPPQAWRFSCNEFGKPSTDPACGLEFNLANAHNLVVCLIAEGSAVGVDVEPYDHKEQIAELAPNVFSARELAQLDALNGVGKLDRGLSLWTLKESYIKARGMGLSLPLQKFSFLFGDAEGIRLELDPSLEDKAERWRFGLLEHAGHRIALMLERAAGSDVQVWESRPLLASPTLLPAGVAEWFPRIPQVCFHP